MSLQEAGDGLESMVEFQVQIKGHNKRLILIAFITGNSSLELLIEGLCAQIHVNLR